MVNFIDLKPGSWAIIHELSVMRHINIYISFSPGRIAPRRISPPRLIARLCTYIPRPSNACVIKKRGLNARRACACVREQANRGRKPFRNLIHLLIQSPRSLRTSLIACPLFPTTSVPGSGARVPVLIGHHSLPPDFHVLEPTADGSIKAGIPTSSSRRWKKRTERK